MSNITALDVLRMVRDVLPLDPPDEDELNEGVEEFALTPETGNWCSLCETRKVVRKIEDLDGYFYDIFSCPICGM